MGAAIDPKAGRRRAFVQAGIITRGSYQGFKVHLKDRTEVKVSSISDILDWLEGCRYKPDVRDEWQRPSQFEKTRLGDEEEFALWAWVKLLELGHDAELHIGMGPHRSSQRPYYKDVWTVFTDGGGFHQVIWLLVSAERRPVVTYQQFTTDFKPKYAIDARGRKYRY